jgi:uncharacterized protein YbjT (DUF2867 family)
MNVIITGVTGMVGEGVLYECLQDSSIKKITVIARKTCGYKHEKLTEIIHKDFLNITSIENELKGFDSCFFCLGVSSVGMSKEDYEKYTYELTLQFAKTVINPNMTFCYVSGAGTDSTEKARSHWARVKGKTENDLFKLPFKKAYAFRPGYMQPTEGLKYALKYYRSLSWSYPLLHFLFPKYVCTLKEVGQAMIKVVKKEYPKNVLEVKDIVALAAKQ